ncbi:MAG: radical SAM protein [Acholeplasmatales bacterium]|nr:MAG: radical SAM protein [Acholeplasmatales bacterium]
MNACTAIKPYATKNGMISMRDSAYLYGPVLSRRLGRSLGISPFITKYCNFDCLYCQLGPTAALTNTPAQGVAVETLIAAFNTFLKSGIAYDTVTVSGLGEPTLYRDLKKLLIRLKTCTDKPVTLITNGARFDHRDVFDAALEADIVLPTVMSEPVSLAETIHRPHPHVNLKASTVYLKQFSQEFHGELWLEVMLLKDINDSAQSLRAFKQTLKGIRYDRLYINVPLRAGTDKSAQVPPLKRVMMFAEALEGISIEALAEGVYQSAVTDDYEAILNIIRTHPLHRHEIEVFMKHRQSDATRILKRLNQDPRVRASSMKGLTSYRLKH